MKNAFNVNLPKANPKLKSAVSALVSPQSASPEPKPTAEVSAARPPPLAAPVLKLPPARARPLNEAHRAWFGMLNELEGHLTRAVHARGKLRGDVDDARSVLARTGEAAAEALHRLALVDKQLQDRNAALTSLLAEIDRLKTSRSDALHLARRLSRLDRIYA